MCNEHKHKHRKVYVKFWLFSVFWKMESSGHTGLDFQPGSSCRAEQWLGFGWGHAPLNTRCPPAHGCIRAEQHLVCWSLECRHALPRLPWNDFGLVALWHWLQAQTPGRNSEGAVPAHSLQIPIVLASDLENWPTRLRMMGPQT